MDLRILVIHPGGEDDGDLQDVGSALRNSSSHLTRLVAVVPRIVTTETLSDEHFQDCHAVYIYSDFQQNSVLGICAAIRQAVKIGLPLLCAGSAALVALKEKQITDQADLNELGLTPNNLMTASRSWSMSAVDISSKDFERDITLFRRIFAVGCYFNDHFFVPDPGWNVVGTVSDNFWGQRNVLFSFDSARFRVATLFHPHRRTHPARQNALIDAFVSSALPSNFTDLIQPEEYVDGPLDGQEIARIDWPQHRMYKIVETPKNEKHIYFRRKFVCNGSYSESEIRYGGDWSQDFSAVPNVMVIPFSTDFLRHTPRPEFNKTMTSYIGRCVEPSRLDVIEFDSYLDPASGLRWAGVQMFKQEYEEVELFGFLDAYLKKNPVPFRE